MMKLLEHKISKVLTKQDTKKASAAAGETSGHTKLACYAVKILNENNIVASYENICAAMWTMFPKIDKFHLYGFDDIPDTDYMEKCIKLRGIQSHDALTGGSNPDKSIREPLALTEKGAVWASEVEGILTGKIRSSAKDKQREKGQTDYHAKDLRKIIDSELCKISIEDPNTSVEKPEIAYALGVYYRDKTFDADFKKRLKTIDGWLKQRKTDKKHGELDIKIKDFISWLRSKGSM